VVVGVGGGVTVTVQEHVLAPETRVWKVVGEALVEVVGGFEAESGTVSTVLPVLAEMARTREDAAVLAETAGSVTPAGVEVRDVRVAATAVEDDGADTPAAAEDDDADTTATTVEADIAPVLRALEVAVAVAPLTVRPPAWAMATRGAVLMVAAVTTPSPFVVRVTGFAMFSRARQPRSLSSNAVE
jgi:hypothetical protein